MPKSCQHKQLKINQMTQYTRQEFKHRPMCRTNYHRICRYTQNTIELKEKIHAIFQNRTEMIKRQIGERLESIAFDGDPAYSCAINENFQCSLKTHHGKPLCWARLNKQIFKLC